MKKIADFSLIDYLKTGIALVSVSDGTILKCNPAFSRVFCGSGDAKQASIWECFAMLDQTKVLNRLNRGRAYVFDSEVTPKNSVRSLYFRSSLRQIDSNDELCWLLECVDISKEKETEFMLDSYSKMMERAQAKLVNQAYRDHTTQLWNQNALVEEYRREQEQQNRDCIVFLIELDFFEAPSNLTADQLHDKVLKNLSSLLKRNRPKESILAYLGDDQLCAVVFANNSLEPNPLIKQLVMPPAVDSDSRTTINIIVNIGYALSTEHGLVLDDLMNAADKSVISAKELGRSYALKLVD